MNPKSTSTQEILTTCRTIVSLEGIDGLNMRRIANEVNIALGALYNYYPSKNALISAAVESIWQEIFHLNEPVYQTEKFSKYVEWMYDCVSISQTTYPHFSFTHSLLFSATNKHDAQETMHRCFQQLKDGMMYALNHDSSIMPNCFNSFFTKKDFIDFVFSSFFMSLSTHQDNRHILLQVINKCIYH